MRFINVQAVDTKLLKRNGRVLTALIRLHNRLVLLCQLLDLLLHLFDGESSALLRYSHSLERVCQLLYLAL